MLEEGRLVPANPSCEEGLHYHNTSCYWFSSTRMDFGKTMDSCAKKGAYLTDILSQEENSFIKDISMVINPKDGTDYWAGGEAKIHRWISGANMTFTDFYPGAKKGHKYIHMNFDANFAWDTKWDMKDRDNRYICKKSI